jgi:hypothetical protein
VPPPEKTREPMRKITVDLNDNLDLAAVVSPREEDEGYEEASSKTTKTRF